MSLMNEALEQAVPIWNHCMETPFVQELKNGTLSVAKFKHYIIQDSIYLKHYARVYGKAMYHASTLKEIQMFYSVLSFVTDTESAVRLNYLKEFGLTDDDIEGIAPCPENQHYIDFMLEIAEEGNLSKILMAVLPCMLSYSYIFHQIAAEPEAKASKYWDFIADYGQDRYREACQTWIRFADEKCPPVTPQGKQALIDIFVKASQLELDFWKMAYGA